MKNTVERTSFFSRDALVDYHIHSAYSVDSEADMAGHCRRAGELGLSEICFTEHMDFDPAESNTGYFDYDLYMGQIARIQTQFDGSLCVRAGVEIDYVPQFEREISAFLTGKDFDFVLGAVHYLDGFNISEPRAWDYFRGKDVEDAYGRYFERVAQCAQFPMFDSLGHLDLVKRFGTEYYGPLRFGQFEDQIRQVLKAAIASDTGIEINTSGLRQSPKETYPSIDVLRLYEKLGGKVVIIGSDAHVPSDLGRGLDEALRMLYSAGFKSLARFEKRRRCETPIGRTK